MDLFSIKASRHVHKNSNLAEAFTDVICAYVKAIQKAEEINSRPLKGGLDMGLRILTGSHATFISEKIFHGIKQKTPVLNPFELIWEQRHSMGQVLVKNRKRSFAVWEHTQPIKEFRENLIRCDSKKEIVDTIHAYPGVAWISRNENDALNSLGYQNKRPGGFLRCYEEAGIILLNEQMYKNKAHNKT